MSEIRPFKGIVYNQKKIRDLASVVAPPYDVIPPDMQDDLYRANPYNVVRLILGNIRKGDDSKDNRYTRARNFFNSWLKKSVLIRDDKETLYIYSQSYKEGGEVIDRIGLFALMEIDRGKRRKVLAHENTLRAPKIDRLNLMRQVKANLSPIFVLYDDNSHKILKLLKKTCSKKRPFIDVDFDSVRHRVWRLDDASGIRRIKRLLGGKDIFIADGHHRYEVARMYSLELEKKRVPDALKKAARYLMVYLVESDERMLTILPAHRLVKEIGSLTKSDILERLGRSFRLYRVRGLDALMRTLKRFYASSAFGMYLGNKEFYVLRLKDPKLSDRAIKDKPREWKRLDVSILHFYIFQHLLGLRDDDDNVEFVKDPQEAAASVDSGRCKLAFFLNPTKVSQVKRIATLGARMPRKATYFYPKPLSGLVINKF